MTQLVSALMIEALDIAQIKANLGFGVATGLQSVPAGSDLNAVIVNSMTGYDIVLLSREFQQTGSGVLQEQNFRNPSALTGVTTGTLSNRYIQNPAVAQSLFNSISWTYGVQTSAVSTGTAGLTTSVAPLAGDAANPMPLIIGPGASFGISLLNPSGTGALSPGTAVTCEIALVGFIRPV